MMMLMMMMVAALYRRKETLPAGGAATLPGNGAAGCFVRRAILSNFVFLVVLLGRRGGTEGEEWEGKGRERDTTGRRREQSEIGGVQRERERRGEECVRRRGTWIV